MTDTEFMKGYEEDVMTASGNGEQSGGKTTAGANDKAELIKKIRHGVVIALLIVGAAAWFSQIFEVMVIWFILVFVFAVLIIMGRVEEKHEDNTVIYDE